MPCRTVSTMLSWLVRVRQAEVDKLQSDVEQLRSTSARQEAAISEAQAAYDDLRARCAAVQPAAFKHVFMHSGSSLGSCHCVGLGHTSAAVELPGQL